MIRHPQLVTSALLAALIAVAPRTPSMGQASSPGNRPLTPPFNTPPVVAPTPSPGVVTPSPSPGPGPGYPTPYPPIGYPRPRYRYPPIWINPPIFVGPTVPVGYPVPVPYPLPVEVPEVWGGGFDAGRGAVMVPPAPARRLVRPVTVRRRRAEERLLVGDRLFRAGSLNRAVERYEQAGSADPTSAEPAVRLAQVAIARGDYGDAANRLREAQVIDPDYLPTAKDIQNLFGDPKDFAQVLADLEAHIRANPNDRDARLVLGAELYFTGRTPEAAIVFRALADRKPDATLAAFLDASRADP